MSTKYARVCQWLVSHGSASIQDFMEALNIPKSTVHRRIAKLIADGWGVNYQSAVFAGNNTGVERIIVQRNKLHHPRSDTNSWAEHRALHDTYHPRGPQAVTFKNSKGNHVIRYNEVYSDDDHYFNDGLVVLEIDNEARL